MTFSAILCLSLATCFCQVSSAIYNCMANGNTDCVTNEPNSDICSADACVCNINYEIAIDDCALKSCTNAGTDCGTNTACTTGGKCSCIANFAGAAAACSQITCTADSICTTADSNSHCDGSNCVCKNNFDGATSADCTRVTCANNAACTNDYSYCATGTAAGCTCGFSSPAHSSTGVCTPTTCTMANGITTCTGASSCIATTSSYECLCGVNYIPGATDCVQKACSAVGDCDADTACTGSLCVCASTFAASGLKCKKECTGTGAGVCHAQTTCTGGVCECNVNYAGNGATCTQLTCFTTVVTTCNPNSKCASELCECADDFVSDGTICRKSCTTATAGTACSTNALCIDSKCQCKQNYAGDGATCNQASCSAASDCGTNTACTGSVCECATGYEISSTAVECVHIPTTAETTAETIVETTTASGAKQIVFYNSLMLLVGVITSGFPKLF